MKLGEKVKVYFLVEYNSETEDKKDEIENLLHTAIKTSLSYMKFSYDAEISVTFVSDDEIQNLNKEYRNIDKSTDVLSFPLSEDFVNFDFNHDTNAALLGDIVISIDHVKSQAIEYNHSFARELSYLVVHSCLHLLGFDHENEDDKKIMREHEKNIMEKLQILR